MYFRPVPEAVLAEFMSERIDVVQNGGLPQHDLPDCMSGLPHVGDPGVMLIQRWSCSPPSSSGGQEEEGLSAQREVIAKRRFSSRFGIS